MEAESRGEGVEEGPPSLPWLTSQMHVAAGPGPGQDTRIHFQFHVNVREPNISATFQGAREDQDGARAELGFKP